MHKAHLVLQSILNTYQYLSLDMDPQQVSSSSPNQDIVGKNWPYKFEMLDLFLPSKFSKFNL